MHPPRHSACLLPAAWLSVCHATATVCDACALYAVLVALMDGCVADYWTSIIVDKDAEQYKNIHWDPQTDFCGLKKFYPLFNFVGKGKTTVLSAKDTAAA